MLGHSSYIYCSYNKTEHLSIENVRRDRKFGYLLLGAPENGTLADLTLRMQPRFSTWFTLDAFDRVQLPSEPLAALRSGNFAALYPHVLFRPAVAVMSYTLPKPTQ